MGGDDSHVNRRSIVQKIFRSRAGGRDKRVGAIRVIDGGYMLIAT